MQHNQNEIPIDFSKMYDPTSGPTTTIGASAYATLKASREHLRGELTYQGETLSAIHLMALANRMFKQTLSESIFA